MSIQRGINTTCHVCFEDWEGLGPIYMSDLNNLRKCITSTVYNYVIKKRGELASKSPPLTGKASGSAFILPVQVKFGIDWNAATKKKMEDQISSFNVLRRRKTKNGMTIRILSSKVVGKQRNEDRRLELHFQCSKKTENENWISNSVCRWRG